MTVMEQIHKTYLVPVVVMENADKAVDTAKALASGGVDVMEITLRTGAGLDAIENVAKGCPDTLVGAGTVLSLEQCREAVSRGAKFIVSPGYDPEVVAWCQANRIDVLPGCVTPSEITTARNTGLRVVKFFPASVYGGLKAIKALSGPFPDMKFVPTGGVGLENLDQFVTPEVFAIGGGWLCEKKAIQEENWEAIRQICLQSQKIVQDKRA